MNVDKADSRSKSLFKLNMHQFSMLAVPLFLFSILTSTAGLQNPAHHLATDVSINCGGAGISPADRGREWVGDGSPRSTSFLQMKGSSATSTVAQKLITTDQVPYRTARISLSEFSYTFQLNPGQKLIRLHFNSVPYKGFENFKDLFTVKGGNFILLGNFSASLTAYALRANSFAKEFVVNVEENQPFTVAFSPASTQSHEDAYAFINGIEITSVPSDFSYFNRGIKVVDLNSVVYIDNGTALETVHRRNIKRDSALLGEDDYSGDVFGMWGSSPEKKGNGFKNIIWNISVDVGFRYLVRFHFSELGLKIAEIGAMNFTVLINGILADSNAEKAGGKGYNGDSWCRDYMVMMKGLKQHGKHNLSVSLELSSEFLNENPLLKGFEIFKLSNPDNSLASPNAPPQAWDRKDSVLIPERNTITSTVIAVITLVNVIVYKLRKIWEAGFMAEERKPSARAERVCRRFSLSVIKAATRNFDYGLIVGKGGFGNVYRGFLDKGREIVAIKRLKSTSRQGEHEFLTEINTLSELQHVNLVSLIGYCCEKQEMILVYEYMARGTLSDNLYKLEKGSNYCYPSWEQCLKICIGAARGLDYLHTGYGLIHRDVKASNILLDENLMAKISDFGLAKLEKNSGDEMQTHVSTNVKGTFGYLDPKYLTNRKLTRKSDTYAFGVVLLEVLCGRPALYSGPENRSLTTWALEKIREGEVDEIVASSLREQIAANSLKTFVEVAEGCLRGEPKERPTMARVVLQLEFALEQQENAKSEVPKDVTNVAEETLIAIDSVKPNFTFEEQTKKEAVSNEPPKGRKYWRKAVAVHNPSWLKPWNSILNRGVSAKKKQLVCVSITESEGGVKLPKFDLAGIAAATNQFAPSNKIGVGVIGTVYEAVFSTGLRVVVKRPWSFSNQGIKNEFLLLPRLQHPNIVKLLGYCTYREETMLVYEFVENGDLASFLLHDKVRFDQLNWAVRFKIITGIARGLVYLHEGFGIIHRCLMPNSILLDSEMNPKIATFGFARTLAQNQFELEEPKITFGSFAYMSPECYKQGKFSVKSDAYSFGVIVLEILSGRICIDNEQDPEFLVDTAIELWNEGKALDIVDRSMQGLFSEEEVSRCIRVAISCINPEPHDRPTMASVVKFLGGKESSLGIQHEAVEDFQQAIGFNYEYQNEVVVPAREFLTL